MLRNTLLIVLLSVAMFGAGYGVSHWMASPGAVPTQADPDPPAEEGPSDLMTSLVFLLLGVMVTRTADELARWCDRRADALKARRKEFATYRPTPAVEPGSPAARRLVAERDDRISARPMLNKLRRQIQLWEIGPVLGWAAITAVLLFLAVRQVS